MFAWLREFLEIKRFNYETRLRLKEEALERLSLCNSCEVLKVELSKERREKEMLLQHLLSSREPTIERDENPKEPVPLLRHKPWRVKQQELEAADRAQAARIMTEFKDKVKQATKLDTDKLEESIGIK